MAFPHFYGTYGYKKKFKNFFTTRSCTKVAPLEFAGSTPAIFCGMLTTFMSDSCERRK